MEIFTFANEQLIAVFCIGYVAIILEPVIRIHKTALALLLAVACWLIYLTEAPQPMSAGLARLWPHLSEVSGILFFLLGAMTLVELIDAHNGFETFIRYLHTE